ncbi:hypothetical protein CK203_088324 [Vitis vinifera]|uniref:Uncharacterized protein n=1 Tax=Vitis vinifera TaxID=29760 RepID=A0A438DNZ2_VITVI|nr:hypothetical protein CK203_088324 [Vitis vinifera]
MLRKMKSQPLLFVEVLFWKIRRECHYITSQSLLHELGSAKKESGKWGNISRHGEIGSTQGKGWMHRSIADAPGEDEADVVISHEPVYQKNDDNFSEVEEDIPPISSSEIDGNTNFNKFKDDRHCILLIGEALDRDCKVSPVRVSNKL